MCLPIIFLGDLADLVKDLDYQDHFNDATKNYAATQMWMQMIIFGSYKYYNNNWWEFQQNADGPISLKPIDLKILFIFSHHFLTRILQSS